MWSIHTIEYVLDIRRTEVLIDVTTWGTPEDMIQVKEARRKTMYRMSLII